MERQQLEKLTTVFATKSKKGTWYYSGKDPVGGYINLFDNSKGREKNQRAPHISVCKGSENVGGLWQYASKTGTQYYLGNIHGQKVIGFKGKSKDGQYVFINIYKDEDRKPQQKPVETQAFVDDSIQF